MRELDKMDKKYQADLNKEAFKGMQQEHLNFMK
jgi:hypothetical protein